MVNVMVNDVVNDVAGDVVNDVVNVMVNGVVNDVADDVVNDFQIGAGLYAVGRPVQQKRTAKSAPITPCHAREGPYSTVFSVSRPMDPLMWLVGLWPYRGMSRRIPDRQPRLGLATCVRQNTQLTTTKPNNR